MEQSGNNGSGELNTPEQTEALISEVVCPIYASLLDADEGTLLNYKPTTIVNGKMCAQIEIKDVAPEVGYWQHAILCSVLGANPPYEVIKGFVQQIWADFEIDKILMVRKGLFLVRFVQLQGKLTVEKRGLYYFDRKPFIVKGWKPDMDINAESIQSLPLWVQFPELDIKYWGLDSLSKLGSLIGIPLKTDHYTREKTMIKYARLLIEVPMAGPFPDFIEFFNEHGELIRQSIKFEWKPSKCNHCRMYGHLEEECRKKHNQRKEWRRVQVTPQEAPKETTQSVPTAAEDGNYIAVTRKAAAKQSTYTAPTLDQAYHLEILKASQRQELWDDLQNLAPRSEAWCIMGDFNAVLRWEDRIGGDIVTEHELMELKSLLEACELHELHTMGPYYTWINKTVWSRLDRVLLNTYWYAGFDYTYAQNIPMGLSDHTPILMQFIDTPRPKPSFQYCEM
ncbi:hypothetical protein Cgig2_023655 [Carnegiea gigantea]|uniref:DUF4283 domain-containing protein n=1 Tax=Carnegiea gigantea TaxID=171969 RepID=A0A9Q1JFE5_9CARY|nr:hypothetical protein Cgig2_023655 [Carnegiea gigantea]